MRSGRGAAAPLPPPVDDDLARIERAIADVMRVAASPKLHEARMRAARLTLSRTELRFLMRLVAGPALSVSRLGDELDVSQPTASRSLHELEGQGLVVRRADAADGRLALYEPTAKGRRVCARLDAIRRDQLAGALDDLPAARRRELAAALEELATRLSTRR